MHNYKLKRVRIIYSIYPDSVISKNNQTNLFYTNYLYFHFLSSFLSAGVASIKLIAKPPLRAKSVEIFVL